MQVCSNFIFSHIISTWFTFVNFEQCLHIIHNFAHTYITRVIQSCEMNFSRRSALQVLFAFSFYFSLTFGNKKGSRFGLSPSWPSYEGQIPPLVGLGCSQEYLLSNWYGMIIYRYIRTIPQLHQLKAETFRTGPVNDDVFAANTSITSTVCIGIILQVQVQVLCTFLPNIKLFPRHNMQL